MRTLCVALLAVGLGAFVIGCKKRGSTTDPSSTNDKNVPGVGAGKRGTFTVGKTTTRVTGPVESDGHIDYAAALNERLSKGATAENNANVAIWKVFGPSSPGAGKPPAGYFEMMGMPAPAATGDYFVSPRAYFDRATPGQTTGNIDAATALAKRPWTGRENAAVGGWLAANEKHLAALREATQRSQYYNPLIPEKGDKGSKGLFTALLPGVQSCREVALAFAARAMLYTGQGNTAEAWQDLLACHRLGRLVGRGGMLLEHLVGLAIELIACQGEVAFLSHAKPDGPTIQGCLNDLAGLPARSDTVEKVDQGERFAMLETIMLLDRNGVAHLASMSGGQPAAASAFGDAALVGIDWNPALESANKWYDRMAAAMRERDRAKRLRQFDQIDADVQAMKSSIQGGATAAALKASGAGAADRGAAVGDILVTLMMPAARKNKHASERAAQTYENVVTAFALEWYQRFNGQYPAKLADLVPTYLTVAPSDLFTGKEPVYRPEPTGFLLYSLGPNGRDDGARTIESQPPGDDIAVRIPQPKR